MSALSDVVLRAARYRRLPNPGFAAGTAAGEACARLGDEVGGNTRAALEAVGDTRVDRSYLCSTIIDLPLSGDAFDHARFAEAVQAHGPHLPQTFVNAYECSCWGYILRQVAQDVENEGTTRVMINIADVDVLNLTRWRANEAWGASGFGIMTLLLDLGSQARAQIATGSARTEQHVTEFVLATRKFVAETPELPLALPYLPQAVSGMFTRTLAPHDCLPNLNPELGHCFGSDPWVGIVRHRLGRPPAVERYIATSIALHGYWTLARVRVPANAHISWENRP